jgi:hypothetical protein
MVFDTAAESINQTPFILYTTGEGDFTDAILAEINAGAPAETKSDNKVPPPATDPKAAPAKTK